MSSPGRVVVADTPDSTAARCSPAARRRRCRQPSGVVAERGVRRAHNAQIGITARGDTTREHIMRRAGELIPRHHVDATTAHPVHQASVTSKSPLHRHFCDKEHLVRSVLDEEAQALLAQQRRELQAVTTATDLNSWRDRLVDANRQRGGAFGCVLGTMASQLVDRDEPSRLMLAGYFAEWQHLTASALRRLQTTGELHRDADADELAIGLIAALQGGYLLAQASRDVDDMAAAIDMALNRIRSFAHAG